MTPMALDGRRLRSVAGRGSPPPQTHIRTIGFHGAQTTLVKAHLLGAL